MNTRHTTRPITERILAQALVVARTGLFSPKDFCRQRNLSYTNFSKRFAAYKKEHT